MLTIHKADANGNIVFTYSGWLLDDREAIIVLARWRQRRIQLPYVTFAEGDILIETFYRTRVYNIFALFDGSRVLEGPPFTAMVEQIRSRMRQHNTRQAARDHGLPDLPCTCPLKGFYVNFTHPPHYDAQAQVLTWRDLALDLWVPAQGQPLLLDADEYKALALAQQQPELARRIADTCQQLWDHALHHTGPFASTATTPL